MSLILNALIPGAGLILRGRHWLGFVLAMLFAFSINVAIAGWLVAPVAIPPIYSWAATLMAATSWALAQLSMVRPSSARADDDPAVAVLLQKAKAALANRDWGAAQSAIEGALEHNHENAEMNDLHAQVVTLAENEPEAASDAPPVRKPSDSSNSAGSADSAQTNSPGRASSP